ncbi:hypothetical protein CF319_g7194 [Tilletia indica]|nr:hypothetical protein CF319_g7194 [Tilletia indica]
MGKYIGQRHGPLRGPYEQIPDPGPSYARLQLKGPMIGFWGVVLSNGSSLEQATSLLEEIYGDKLIFTSNGQRLESNRPISFYRLADGATIDIGRASPPDIAPENPLEDPDTLRYIQPGKAQFLPPSLPGLIKLQFRSEKTGPWAATIRTDAPFSLIGDHINHQYRGSVRFCLDGTRLAETMTVAENMLEDGDDIDIYSEQVGGGDTASTFQDTLPGPPKEPKALRYLIEGTLKYLPPHPNLDTFEISS